MINLMKSMITVFYTGSGTNLLRKDSLTNLWQDEERIPNLLPTYGSNNSVKLIGAVIIYSLLRDLHVSTSFVVESM